jgi:hypothetical protein
MTALTQPNDPSDPSDPGDFDGPMPDDDHTASDEASRHEAGLEFNVFRGVRDIDEFRRFVFGSRFMEIYEIDPDIIEQLKTNDEALLALGFDWLKNVMFNEPTISMKQQVLQEAIGRTRDDLGAA